VWLATEAVGQPDEGEQISIPVGWPLMVAAGARLLDQGGEPVDTSGHLATSPDSAL
jgi:hypothetical protein